MARDVSPWAVTGLYIAVLLLAISPVVEVVLTVWPPRPSDVTWRYGALGLTGGYLPTPVFGAVLLAGVAYWRGHRGVLRALGGSALVAAVLVLLLAALFALDLVQVRALRAEDQRAAVMVGGLVQIVKYLAAFAALAALGLGALKTPGDAPSRVAQSKGSPGVLRGGG